MKSEHECELALQYAIECKEEAGAKEDWDEFNKAHIEEKTLRWVLNYSERR